MTLKLLPIKRRDRHSDWTQRGKHWRSTSVTAKGENPRISCLLSDYINKYSGRVHVLKTNIPPFVTIHRNVLCRVFCHTELAFQFLVCESPRGLCRNSISPCFSSPVVGRVLGTYTCVLVTLRSFAWDFSAFPALSSVSGRRRSQACAQKLLVNITVTLTRF